MADILGQSIHVLKTQFLFLTMVNIAVIYLEPVDLLWRWPLLSIEVGVISLPLKSDRWSRGDSKLHT